jgi:hypothetical protein
MDMTGRVETSKSAKTVTQEPDLVDLAAVVVDLEVVVMALAEAALVAVEEGSVVVAATAAAAAAAAASLEEALIAVDTQAVAALNPPLAQPSQTRLQILQPPEEKRVLSFTFAT